MDRDLIVTKLARLAALQQSLRNTKAEFDKGLLALGQFTKLSMTLRQERSEIMFQLQTGAKADGADELAELMNKAMGSEDDSIWQQLLRQLTTWIGQSSGPATPSLPWSPGIDISPPKPIAQVFLSYAREDEKKVVILYQRLFDDGFKPWMDTKDILPGEKWRFSIQKAIRRSDFFLACLSAKSVSKRGFLQKEIKDALDIWQKMLDSDIYLIPVRLEDCEVPETLHDFHWVNLFEEDGWTQLAKAIYVGMERRAEGIKPIVQESTPFKPYPAHEKPSRGTVMATPEEGPERIRESIRPVLALRPEEQRRLADEIWECLSKAIEVNQAYQADKAEYEAERAMGFGDPQFFRREARYLQERRTWLSEARKKLPKEYGEERRLLDLLVTSSPEQTIREALKTTIRSRGLDETQFQQISGDGGDILSQVALFIRDLITPTEEQKGGYLMAEWISMLKGAAEIAASAKTLGGVAGNVISWFENLLRPSDDQRAKKVWEDFKQDPERNKDALAQVAMRLKPGEDPILKGYVLGVARQYLQANRSQVLILLSGPRYTHSQVISICRQLNPATPGLGRDPSQQDAAAWAVNHTATQERLEDILMRAMVEINPEVVTEIVKLI